MVQHGIRYDYQSPVFTADRARYWRKMGLVDFALKRADPIPAGTYYAFDRAAFHRIRVNAGHQDVAVLFLELPRVAAGSHPNISFSEFDLPERESAHGLYRP